MRSRRVALAIVGTLVVATAGPAQAAPLVVVDDPSGDVRIGTATGPSDLQRRSIDLRQFKVVKGEDSVRFKFRIRRITVSDEFMQALTVNMEDADPESPDVAGDVTAILQPPRSTTGYVNIEDESGGSGLACRLSPPLVLKAKSIVKVDVPLDCIAPGPLRLRVVAATRDRDFTIIYSRDALRVPGTYDLGGTADQFS